MNILLQFLIVVSIMGFVSACGGGGSNTPEPPTGGTQTPTPTVSASPSPSSTVSPSPMPGGIVITAPAEITVAAENASGTVATQQEIASFLASATALNSDQEPIPEVSHNAPEVFPLGSTEVIFEALDANQNRAQARSSVTILDMTAPVVSLIGEASIVLSVGDTYEEFGASASDNVDGDLSTAIAIEGSVDTTTAGDYTLVYSVSDAANNAATAVSRLVSVEEGTSGTGMTVYFKKPAAWSSAYMHYFDVQPLETLANSVWPGVKMEALGSDWYRYRLSDAQSAGLVFSDNGGAQSEDLARAGDGCYDFEAAAWSDTCTIPLGVSASPGSRNFTSPFLDILLSVSGNGVAHGLYSLDGSDPKEDGARYLNGQSLSLGADLAVGESLTLRLYANRGAEEVEASFTFTKQAPPQAGDFSWDNATVYFVLTDRFLDADESNNNSYGRERSQSGEIYAGYKEREGTFHGGDLKGLTQKLNDGYFTALGVNAIWISSPLEQVHGYVGGEDFKHYAYHGYYHLDFTELDANMGTREEFREFVDTAHAKGIRVVMDIVLNHAGYETIGDMAEFNFGALASGWENYYFTPNGSSIHYNTYAPFVQSVPSTQSAWGNWWGGDWIRKSNDSGGYPGYPACGSDDKSMCLAGLPDFRTESQTPVSLPPLLVNKWSAEKLAAERAELDAFFQETGLQATVANHIVKWLSDWVREYGIDGFRVDTAKHVELSVWQTLKTQSSIAYEQWKDANPSKLPDAQDLDFWMTGEVWNHGVGRSEYFDHGFDSVINFRFQEQAGNLAALDAIYSEYASKINSDSSFNVLSYISSHDTALFSRDNMFDAGTSLLLLPGAVQIFYGDETNRPGDDDFHWDQPTRSDMNWDAIDQANLEHWQKLGQFRARHLAVGAGSHTRLSSSPYIFKRALGDDVVVVAIGANGGEAISVASAFADGETLVDAYGGAQALVVNGAVTLQAVDGSGIVLLEKAQ